MTNSLVSKFLFSLIASVCLACSSGPAFAQRGGGGGSHGGGGFSGGGGGGFRGGGGGGFSGGGAGFRGGGGSGFSGGGTGFRGGGFSGGYRGMPAPRGGGGYVRSGVPGGYRSYAYPGSRSMRPGLGNGSGRAMGPSGSSRPAISDGRWNTFAQRGSGPGAATPAPAVRSGAIGGGWQSFSRSRAPAVESAPARGATAPNALAGRNSISQASAISAIHRSFGNSDFGNLRSGSRSGTRSGLRSGLNAPASASSLVGRSATARPGGPAAGPATAPRNSSSAGSALNRFGSRDFNRFGNFGRFGFHSRFDNDFDDFFFFRRPFFGCCGFGFGGFGFGDFDFGFGAPLWWGSGWPGWYGGPGYPYGLPYGYSLPYDLGLTYDPPTAGGPPSDDSSGSGAYRPTRNNSENSSAILLLYLKDGTMSSARDCWLAAGELHCTATDGSERVFELSAIDFQRTVDENAKRGVPFTLKPSPASSKPPY
jgi:hypothetical protein